MIVRLAAAASLLLGFGATGVYLHVMGKSPTSSPAARHLREMKDRATSPDSATAVTLAGMTAMPKRLSLAEYSGLERRAVSFDGYVHRVARAADGDFHLELVETPVRRGDPSPPYFTGEITPQWHSGSRAWSYDRLIERFRPNHGGVTEWEQGPRRVRVTGWLLYDYEYEDAAAPRPRLTTWEIHPVTRIESWDDSLGRFVEYRR